MYIQDIKMESNKDFLKTETLFNAGVSVALEIAYYIRMCGYFAFKGKYSEWYRSLQIIERRMEKKLRDNKIAVKEFQTIKEKGFKSFNTYQVCMRQKRKLSFQTLDEVKQYLSDYERAIIYWKDKFGYGMPEKQDGVSSAWN
jgi:hypothetical protein